MRYKTFRTLVLGGLTALVALVVVLFVTCRAKDPDPSKTKQADGVEKPAKTTQEPDPKKEAPKKDEPKAEATSDDEQPLRPLDEQILAKLGKPLGSEKVKDAIPGSAKVSLFQDSGKTSVNRVKIDLDRDEKWDEKWSIEDEDGKPKVKRQVAPADDESYTVEYRLRDGKWVRKK